MEEIKVGEYVRTKDGYIGKLVEYIPNALNYLKIDIGREIRHCDDSFDNFIYTRYGFQLKHSHSIIDLIEVGDYVNGKKIEQIECFSADNKKALFYDLDMPMQVGLRFFTEDDIKSIVTKEQFKEMEYKVNE